MMRRTTREVGAAEHRDVASPHVICGKSTQRAGQSFGKDLGAARSRLGSAHDVMPRVVVVVIVIVVVVVVVQIPASREAKSRAVLALANQNLRHYNNSS